MRSGLGGHEVLALYSEAIAKMPQNPGIPSLFRDIFKNAYLPYRDPETLKSFLKIIDEFDYDHYERIGSFKEEYKSLNTRSDHCSRRMPKHQISRALPFLWISTAKSVGLLAQNWSCVV
jgi:type I restriction enzyme M protein